MIPQKITKREREQRHERRSANALSREPRGNGRRLPSAVGLEARGGVDGWRADRRPRGRARMISAMPTESGRVDEDRSTCTSADAAVIGDPRRAAGVVVAALERSSRIRVATGDEDRNEKILPTRRRTWKPTSSEPVERKAPGRRTEEAGARRGGRAEAEGTASEAIGRRRQSDRGGSLAARRKGGSGSGSGNGKQWRMRMRDEERMHEGADADEEGNGSGRGRGREGGKGAARKRTRWRMRTRTRGTRTGSSLPGAASPGRRLRRANAVERAPER